MHLFGSCLGADEMCMLTNESTGQDNGGADMELLRASINVVLHLQEQSLYFPASSERVEGNFDPIYCLLRYGWDQAGTLFVGRFYFSKIHHLNVQT